jgi:hypothetical protein
VKCRLHLLVKDEVMPQMRKVRECNQKYLLFSYCSFVVLYQIVFCFHWEFSSIVCFLRLKSIMKRYSTCVCSFHFCLLCDVGNYIIWYISFLQTQKELYEKHHNTADGRIRIWFGLRQIMNATDRLLLETRDVAQKLNTGIHMVLTQSLLVYSSLYNLI